MKEKVTAAKLWGIIYPELIYNGMTYLLVFLISMATGILVVLNGAESSALTQHALENAIYAQSLLITFWAALATIPLFIFLRYRDMQIDKINNSLKKYERVSIFKYILIIPFGFLCMLAANAFVSIIVMAMPDYMAKSFDGTSEIIYGSSFVLQVLTAGIAAPVVEELLYRGLVYNRIKKMTGLIPAAVLSSIIFGVIHANWVQAPYAFIIGLVCVYVYERYKSIFAPIILHISANLLSVVISSLPAAGNETAKATESQSAQSASLFMMTVIMGILALGISKIINKTVNPKEIVK